MCGGQPGTEFSDSSFAAFHSGLGEKDTHNACAVGNMYTVRERERQRKRQREGERGREREREIVMCLCILLVFDLKLAIP